MTNFGKVLLFVWIGSVYSFLFTGIAVSTSCVKQTKIEEPIKYEPNPALFELEDEELEDLPEDTGE
jgi:hypothetical protein